MKDVTHAAIRAIDALSEKERMFPNMDTERKILEHCPALVNGDYFLDYVNRKLWEKLL